MRIDQAGAAPACRFEHNTSNARGNSCQSRNRKLGTATTRHQAFDVTASIPLAVIRLVWPLLRVWIHLRRSRMPPERLPDPLWYFAYGSNMNERLFRERRHMTWHEVRVGRLKDYRLAFTVAGGMRPGVSAPANIVPAPDSLVYGALYLLPLRKFARLDNSEGKQYGYLWTEAEDLAGNRLSVVTYKVPHAATEGLPGRAYLNLIREADAPARPSGRLHRVSQQRRDSSVMQTSRWWPWAGAVIGVAALAWVLRRLDLERFGADLAGADIRFMLVVPVAVVAEQWVRAWKWRQFLHSIKPDIPTLHLLGAVMAGYLVGMLVPLGAGALARSWLVARREALTTGGVLATVALDRMTDGIVFALLIPVALVLVAFPDPAGDIRAGLAWAAVGSLVLFALLLLALVAYKRNTLGEGGHALRLAERLPERIAAPVRRVFISFARGITWPRELWRGLGIVVAAVAMKLIAATHFLWAGLAFGVALAPGTYLFLMAFLGFVAVLGHWARIPGTFIFAAIFALGLFGVAESTALAMALVVQGASLLSVALVGALALWRQGVALADVRAAGERA